MFVSDYGANPKILSANMDGSDQRVFVESKVLWPTSLAVDYPARRLYWSDLKLRTVNTVLLDGARLRKQGWLKVVSRLGSNRF